ncbi:hypothetical protein RYH73_16510 [Olivibacter sp. CPCC 100613]|uniref:hypothetical protein n=1 Tax=Olivibacter sp. CPCC 100613 TaxID=3079931 RepID=UPI002FFD2CDE
MKISTTILTIMLVLFVTGIFASNVAFRRQYEKVDKSDLYWNYSKIADKPFRHVKLDGGNLTNIVFEQNPHCSARVLDYWGGYEKDSIKAYVDKDTLHVKFVNTYANLIEKSWLQSNVLILISAPELLSIEGVNTNFHMNKLNQKSLDIRLSGRSRIGIESNNHHFDNLNITQRDSSQVIIKMNPELKSSPIMSVQKVTADLQGRTLLDIGRAYVNELNLNVADSSAIILSGYALKTINR